MRKETCWYLRGGVQMSKDKTKKGGAFSLVLASLLFLFFCMLLAMNFVRDFPFFEAIRPSVTACLSVWNETVSPAVLFLALSIIVLNARNRRPFNYIFIPFSVVLYFTFLCAVHKVTGNTEPAFLMSLISQSRTSLVILLVIVEVLVCAVTGFISTSLNSVYRKHKEKKDAMNVRISTPTEEERPLSKKELKKLEKQARKEKKGRKKKNEEKADESSFTVASSSSNSESEDSSAFDPDSPLSFPETVHVPDFSTIPRSEVKDFSSDKQETSQPVRKDFSVPDGNVVSMSVLENSKRNVERKLAEEKKNTVSPSSSRLFSRGGMLESALEASRKEHIEPGPNNNPIIGYTDRRKTEEKKNSSSFAPSNLSPDHPRYKLFEALKKKNGHSEAVQKEEKTDVSHFPSRSFTLEEAVQKKESSEPVISLRSESVPELSKPQERPLETEAEPAFEEPAAEPAAPEIRIEPPKPAVKKAAPVHHKEESEPVEENILDEEDDSSSQIEFKVGVSGLASNNAGESAIVKRQRKSYNPPSPDLLKDFPETSYAVGPEEQRTGDLIASVMHDFKVEVELADIVKGPTVTLYEYTLAPGVLVSKVLNLETNIGMRIGGQRVRILAPVPGKSAVGIEVPNARRVTVGFKELLKPLKNSHLNVPMILGRDIQGQPKMLDVSKCPHLLIAGTTGSGKSVCINGLVASILYTKGPKDVRLIMVDPKVVELNVYNGIPHLLTPVITEPKRVLKMLSWLVDEMERRYQVFSQAGVRNIENFNSRIKEFGYATEKMPYIVLIMDEFADLMTVIGKDIEDYIRRLMAKARAAGIHVVMATQRPSAEVVTGTIKNNIPTRIAFAASSAVNSRIVLDEQGAENLLGKGDMLLSTQSSPGLVRIQGAFLSEEEVDQIVAFVKTQGEPDYLDEAIFEDEPESDAGEISLEDLDNGDADLYEKAKQICFERKGASASYLQRRLSIGYNRAARLVEQMEEEGIVGPANGSKPREILRYE